MKDIGVVDVEVSAKELQGDSPICRMSWDFSILMFRLWSNVKNSFSTNKGFYLTYNDDETLERMIFSCQKRLYNELKDMVVSGIFPIFVLDGKSPPEKAEYARKRRNKKAERTEVRFLEVLADLKENGPTKALLAKFVTIYKQVSNMPRELSERMVDVISSIGLAKVRAPYEAEPFCVYMVKGGKAHGVFSTDSDVLVHGAEYRLRESIVGSAVGKDGRVSTHVAFMGTCLSEILQKSGLSMEQFRDVCILSECDYNANVRMFAIMGAYKAMKKHGALAGILSGPLSKKDTSCLNYERCLAIFTGEGTNGVDLSEYNFHANPNALEEFGSVLIREMGFGDEIESLKVRVKEMDAIERSEGGSEATIPTQTSPPSDAR